MVIASAFSIFFSTFARLLELTYRVWPSYAGSIVLFTVVIMVLLTPLTLKGTRSMLAMQQLQPEIKKLQKRYADDRQKLNEEVMKFYQENKISPLGGCLPMLIQLPVFWILYEVLLGLTRRTPYAADLGSALTCHVGGTGSVCQNGIVPTAGYFDPKYIAHSSQLFLHMSSTRKMLSLGIDLSQSSLKALGGGFAHAAPYLLMVVIVVATTYIQQVQIQRRTPPDAVNPTQQMTMKIMPVAMGVIYLVIPAGVVVYFLVSNFFRIGQQALVTRTVYAPAGAIPATAKAVASDEPAKKKSFKDNFVPGESSLPRVGKRARTPAAVDAVPGDAVPGTTKTKPGSTPAKQSASSNGKTTTTGAKTAAAAKATPPKAKAVAPSRKPAAAPTRKSPAPPQNRSRKKS